MTLASPIQPYAAQMFARKSVEQRHDRDADVVNESLVRRYGSSRGSVRRLILRYINGTEGGEFYSPTLREIFRVYYGVTIGMYTHGGCFQPRRFDLETVVGRYTSIARSAFSATANHPLHYKSTHAFFFNPRLGVTKEDEHLPRTPLTIGNDVWLGHNSIIMPGVRTIGNGAVVAAGAVVSKERTAYAVVVGNPARVVRYRFDSQTVEQLLVEKWWERESARSGVTSLSTRDHTVWCSGATSSPGSH